MSITKRAHLTKEQISDFWIVSVSDLILPMSNRSLGSI